MVHKKDRFRNPLALESILKLRSAYSPSIAEVVNSFVNMPEHYFRSFSEDFLSKKENLPSSFLGPKRSETGVYYKDIFPPVQDNTKVNKKATKLEKVKIIFL